MAEQHFFERPVAPNVRERHTRSCGRSTGGKRCTCTPAFVARVRVGGERHVATFLDLGEAVDWTQDVRAADRDGRRIDGRDMPTLDAAARRFIHRALNGDALTHGRRRYAKATLDGYERQLRLHILPHRDTPTSRPLGELGVDTIDARAMQRLVDTTTTAVGAQTARIAFATLSAVLRDLYVQGVLDTLPPKVLLPPPSAARERVLTHDEYARLLDACRRDDAANTRSLLYPIIALLGASGCRISEAVALRWGPDGITLDQDPPRLSVQRETTKTDAGRRSVTLDADTAAILADHRARTGSPANGEHAFTRADGGALTRSGLVRFALARAAELAGLERVTPHVLRHSHATWAASANVPTIALAARLGHSDPSFTLRRYTHATQHDLDQIPTLIKRNRDHHTTTKEGTAMPVSPNDAATNRPGIVERYIDDVLPALQRRLDTAFPEFGWRRDEHGWHATNNDHTHARFGVRADRIVSHGDAPSGFLIHGHGPILWTTYVNDGTPARGRDFIRAVEDIAARAGQTIDLTRPPERQHRREEILQTTFDLARELFIDTKAGAHARNYLTQTRGFPPTRSPTSNWGSTRPDRSCSLDCRHAATKGTRSSELASWPTGGGPGASSGSGATTTDAQRHSGHAPSMPIRPTRVTSTSKAHADPSRPTASTTSSHSLPPTATISFSSKASSTSTTYTLAASPTSQLSAERAPRDCSSNASSNVGSKRSPWHSMATRPVIAQPSPRSKRHTRAHTCPTSPSFASPAAIPTHASARTESLPGKPSSKPPSPPSLGVSNASSRPAREAQRRCARACSGQDAGSGACPQRTLWIKTPASNTSLSKSTST